MYNPDGPDHVVPTPSLTIRDFTWLRRHGELQMFAVGWRCRCGGPGGDAAAETLIAQADAGRRTPYRV
jgi:hypothetical protein